MPAGTESGRFVEQPAGTEAGRFDEGSDRFVEQLRMTDYFSSILAAPTSIEHLRAMRNPRQGKTSRRALLLGLPPVVAALSLARPEGMLYIDTRVSK